SFACPGNHLSRGEFHLRRVYRAHCTTTPLAESRVSPLVSATTPSTLLNSTLSMTTPVLFEPGSAFGGAISTAVPTSEKLESMNDAEPILPASCFWRFRSLLPIGSSSLRSLNPISTFLTVIDFQT